MVCYLSMSLSAYLSISCSVHLSIYIYIYIHTYVYTSIYLSSDHFSIYGIYINFLGWRVARCREYGLFFGDLVVVDVRKV